MCDYDEEDEETSVTTVAKEKRSKTIRFDDEAEKENEEEDVVAPGEESGPQVDEIQRKMLKMAGQDIEQYMKEVNGIKLRRLGRNLIGKIFADGGSTQEGSSRTSC